MNTIRSLVLATGAAVTLLGAAAAHAAPTYQFTLTGDYTASWQLSATPTPDDSFSGELFTLWNVSGTFTGASTALADLTFFNVARGGGLSIYDFNAGVSLLSTDGPQLYSGSEGAPTFSLGTYALTAYQGTSQYALMVTQVSTVPEPSSLALLLCGVICGALARRR